MTPAGALPRRTVLAAAALGGAGLVAVLAGCTSTAPAPAPPVTTPPDVARDTAVVERARAAARTLEAQAVALSRTEPRLAGLLAAVEADHAEHLSALGAPAPSPAASPAAPPAPSAAASSAPSGTARPPTPASAVAAELAAAQTALDDAQSTAGGLAVLLTRIAAARAVHADLLASHTGQRAPRSLAVAAQAASGASAAPSPAAAPPSSPSLLTATPTPVAVAALPAAARNALDALAAGEHAAVYAYGVVAARVAAPDRERARAAWAWHERHRDELEDRLRAAGVEPPAAAPAYDLGSRAQDATGLAAAVEDGLAALAARAVATTGAADRRDAAESLVTVARTAAAWRGRPVALPG